VDSYPDRIRDPNPAKIGNNSEISFFEVVDVLFCGLKASSEAWTSFMEA
jgi:hypothetical protein